jgi:hypothetical protein
MKNVPVNKSDLAVSELERKDVTRPNQQSLGSWRVRECNAFSSLYKRGSLIRFSTRLGSNP